MLSPQLDALMKSSKEGSLLFSIKNGNPSSFAKILLSLFCQFAFSLLKSTSYSSVKNVTKDFQKRMPRGEGRVDRNKKLFSLAFHDHFLSTSFDFSSLHPCNFPV